MTANAFSLSTGRSRPVCLLFIQRTEGKVYEFVARWMFEICFPAPFDTMPVRPTLCSPLTSGRRDRVDHRQCHYGRHLRRDLVRASTDP